MKNILLFFALLALAGCTESVLDPNDLHKGGAGSKGEPIYYNTETGGSHELKRIFTGNNEIALLAASSFITSSPVGNKMVYINDSDPVNQSIFISNIDGSGRQLVTTDQGIQSAALSPDAGTVIYTTLYDNGRTSYCRLRSIAFDNSLSGTVIDSLVDPAVIPTFSPDGKYIAYSRLDTIREDILVIHDIANPLLSYEYQIIDNSLTADLEFDWTPDSKNIVCIVGQDVAIVPINNGFQPTYLHFTNAAPFSVPLFPVVSAEGTIAVVGFDFSSSDIYLYDGRGWTNITMSPTVELLPHFSADGKKLLFSSLDIIPADFSYIPESRLMIYEADTIRKLAEGSIVRPLFGR